MRVLFPKLLFLLFIIPLQKICGQQLNFDNGIFAETPVFNDTSQHRFSIDNSVYKTNRVFEFDYYYIDSSNKKFKFIADNVRNNDGHTWLVPYDSVSEFVITIVRLSVNDHLATFIHTDSTYSQTVIKYEYLNAFNKPLGSEETGVIDNRKNVWLHPPRTSGFKLLEINPFPFVYAEATAFTWVWTLEIGDSWSDENWKTWKGILHQRNFYERQKNEAIPTALGLLNCQVIKATGTSEIGRTFLKSYFHPYYGFVRLEYINIDKSKLILQLRKVVD